jgi:3-carboxy-cis,cis-muconate cycloisomerase
MNDDGTLDDRSATADCHPAVMGLLFADLFGTDEMRAVFSDQAMVRAWLRVEAALAEAEAELGVIPTDAAAEIAHRSRTEVFDMGELRREIARRDHPLVPFVWAFAERCEDGAGDYVHWGATTQDIMDTGAVLQLRDALAIIDRRLAVLCQELAVLASAERDTVVAARTHGQQALPTTFGLKAASWLSELLRHQERGEQLRPRLLVGQLGGASGTLASLGDKGTQVRDAMCRALDLGVPTISWHVARDAFAELSALLGMTSASCARIALEVIQLQKTEVGEVEEGQEDGNVGSSAMPQKRNPMTAESVVAVSRLVRRTVPTSLEAMIGEHERDMGAWQTEWLYLPEICILADAALNQTIAVVSSLSLKRDRMRENLERYGGLIMSEAVMLELARSVGRQRAHDLVHAAAMRAVENGTPFVDELLAEPEIAARLSRREIEEVLDPSSYLGSARTMIDAVLAQHSKRTEDR